MPLRGNKSILIVFFILTFYLYLPFDTTKGFAMSLLYHPEEEVVLCSPLEGTITYKGVPAPGARVERIVKWQDDIGDKDIAITDKDGKFTLPIRKGIAKIATITTFVMSQRINVYFNGNEYPVWGKSKRDKGIYGELNGIPVNFRCELTDELVPIDEDKAGKGALVTSCKWDSIKAKE